jgi:sulfur-oxidizing protein SoxY
MYPDFDRREFLAVAGGAAIVVAGAGIAVAQDKPAAAANPYDEAFGKLTKGAKPTEGKVTVDMPEIAENGNTVPFTVLVDSPMSDKDYVKTVHILSPGNPQPVVGSFHFTADSGKASVSGRMRLAKTQDIVAIAEMSDGKLFSGKRAVKVTIGGCGG